MMRRHIVQNLAALGAIVALILTDHGWWSIPIFCWFVLIPGESKCDCDKEKS